MTENQQIREVYYMKMVSTKLRKVINILQSIFLWLKLA